MGAANGLNYKEDRYYESYVIILSILPIIRGVSKMFDVVTYALVKKMIDTLAAVAKSGNVNDLVQTDGDVLILNCGDSSEFWVMSLDEGTLDNTILG